MSENVKDQRWI